MKKNNRVTSKVRSRVSNNTLIRLVILMFLIGLLSSCMEEDKLSDTNYVHLTIETSGVTQITDNSAIVGGNISAPQDRNVTQGICWSTYSNPTTNDYFVNKQGRLGSFTFNLTGLQSGTTYYIRAFTYDGANFGIGSETIYGPQISFSTSKSNVSYSTEYSYDDGISETGWGFPPNTIGLMGNWFPVSDQGFITSVKVYFTDITSSDEYLFIDIYDSNQLLIGTSINFKPLAYTWIDVPINNIPFNGAFYAMVRWSTANNGSFHLGLDKDGDNVYQDLAYYQVNGEWNALSQYAEYNGIFLIRVAAMVNSSNKKAIIYTSKDFKTNHAIGHKKHILIKSDIQPKNNKSINYYLK